MPFVKLCTSNSEQICCMQTVTRVLLEQAWSMGVGLAGPFSQGCLMTDSSARPRMTTQEVCLTMLFSNEDASALRHARGSQ